MKYNIKNLDKTLMELQEMLKTVEVSMLKTRDSSSIALVFSIGHGGKLKLGELKIIIGNRRIVHATRIGDNELILTSGVSIRLLNCCYLP